MPAIHHGRSVPGALLLTATLLLYLGAAALVGAAPASAAPPPATSAAGPSGSADGLLALLAVQQAQLIATDGADTDLFGSSVAVSGDTAVVGALYDDVGGNTQQGSAYVFVRSGTTWSEQQKLTAADGAAGDWFGNSVALTGDTVVVGARDDDNANADQGSVYVFTRSGTTWSEQQKLTVADGGASDYFGRSVAVSRETAVVGAFGDDVGANADQGSAYVFARSGTTWSQQAQLTANDGAANDWCGFSVAISGDTAVVGAEWDDVGVNANQGSAYVFVRSGTVWSQQQQLTAADGATEDWFGGAVALSGETAVVGAQRDHVGITADQGSAYVFARSGTIWSQQSQLTASDGAASDQFGFSVGFSGDTAVVGAYSDDVGATDQGSAYVFTGVAAKPGTPVATSPKGLISSRTPAFRWTAAAGAATYEVRVYKGSRLIRKKAGIKKLSWKFTTALPRKVRLTWTVRARNAGGWGAWSAKPWFEVR